MQMQFIFLFSVVAEGELPGILNCDTNVDISLETVSLSGLLKIIGEQQGTISSLQSQLALAQSQLLAAQSTIDVQRDTIHRYLLDSCPCPTRKPMGEDSHLSPAEEIVPPQVSSVGPLQGNNLKCVGVFLI